METKHTKGEWKWVGNRLKNDDNKIVFTEPQFQTEENIERAEANRRLIAAAPDLLDALQDVLLAFEERETAIPVSTQMKIERAIQKATT